ncbi:hypothetical protein OJAV_G00180560 [Oryzias javanicus]|uniref:Poly [ADP-ribose] polymerase n=1 Tax=Oryzias javanicus TaxID=123683 RepID=A0A3S2LSS4_ORYJA|nr:hypothetical protein OJAV_G00180560 [Oryzias javanicus]
MIILLAIEKIIRQANSELTNRVLVSVRSGAANITGPMKKQQDKRVKLPQDLITFIKNSKLVPKYQTDFQQRFKSPVFLEVGADVVLSSLCPRDLDEAAAALLNELSVEIEKLQGGAAAPPNIARIKQILTKAEKEANCGEVRVNVTFISKPTPSSVVKVRIVGYTKDVSKLRERLLNEIIIEELVELAHPELVDCFDHIFELMSLKTSNVSMKATGSPRPSVTVSGPCRLVPDTHRALASALAKLISDTVVLDEPGALQYFRTDGKKDREEVERLCQVCIREKEGQQSSFLFVGLTKKNVDEAVTKIRKLVKDSCSTNIFTKKDLEDLTEDGMKDLRTLAQQQNLYIQENPQDQGGLMVTGLKSGVIQVVQMVNTAIPLRKELRVKEEDSLYHRVAWCILVPHGSWERLPKADNYNLERGNIANGIVDTKGTKWNVNLEKTEARSQASEQAAKMKRLENLPDFTFPLYWDSMDPGENLKEVLLDPQSEEYGTVLKPFRKTVKRPVLKIVRVQNIHLRRAYEAKNKHFSDKNRLDGGAREKLLYHGTSQDSLDSIKTGGFNRCFSGKNATVHGQGTYFAVDASYSAVSTYSRPADDGSKSIFVARVLTGVFTQGRSDMKVPPPRSSEQPHNRYDSLVDKVENPTMFVVFHDDQAYPDYLITFS